MTINRDTLRGYILEEVLAYLIRTTGYKLLVDPSQDIRELDRRGNGLVVKGRGGVHQVDVLGQLEWIPAFTFPLRLFIEAKFRGDRVGIDAVRNAIGVILDINQNNSPTREQTVFLQKYQYVYALFSTSGFSKPATEMALAHQVSLIDLSGNEFNELQNAITQAANAIVNHVDAQVEGENYEHEDIDISRGNLVLNMRNALRQRLETWPVGINYHEENPPPYLINVLGPVLHMAINYNELFVAMANGPFMLLLKANNSAGFLHYLEQHPRHRVIITWNTIDNGRAWNIIPTENRDAYRLSFRLPEILSKWIFGVPDGVRERALEAKEEYLSNITIYRHINGRDSLFRLEFDREATQRHVEEVNRR